MISSFGLIDRKKKKGTGEAGATEGGAIGGHQTVKREQDNSQFRLLGDWKAEGKVPFR